MLIYLDGWYYDGKKCATLVRDTKYVDVQVGIFSISCHSNNIAFMSQIRGRRGRGSKIQVTTTGTKENFQLSVLIYM